LAKKTIKQALDEAVGSYKAGNIEAAKRLLSRIIQIEPNQPDANHNMGRLLIESGDLEEALHFLKTALEANFSEAQYWFSNIDALFRLNRFSEAAELLEIAKDKGCKGPSFDDLGEKLNSPAVKKEIEIKTIRGIIKDKPDFETAYLGLGNALKEQGKLEEAVEAYKKALAVKPDYADAYYNIGVTVQEQGKLEEAIEAYNKVLAIQPDYDDAYYNMGNVLKKQGKLEEAIEAYTKELTTNPDYAVAYYNIGIVRDDQGKLEEAIEAYTKALAIKPDYADAYINTGIVRHDQGKLEEAMEAYTKALAIKPDFAEIYNNMGIVLADQSEPEEAIEAYHKALSLKPDYAEAHKNLSPLVKYEPNNPQIITVSELIERPDLKDQDMCYLHYAAAKMKEDLGDLGAAFENYVAGGALRQKLLAYDQKQDQRLFTKIKNTAPKLREFSLKTSHEVISQTPVFILGMPRSGTTLVEQIISSHSQVCGAGELSFLDRFGGKLSRGDGDISSNNLLAVRKAYLNELKKVSENKPFVTDKMPHNFLNIGLILKALPEAKVIHVKRDPAATIWSNFKYYFQAKGLGYSYKLEDTVKYYKLYRNLIEFWDESYGGQIYHIDYDKLTVEQEPETRRLIEHLELDWEDACLSPQENRRSVRTASQLQVREKVYKGSSKAWRKFEPYLNGVFDEFLT
jgi:tetratricopeptide (TPR) repeat protein